MTSENGCSFNHAKIDRLDIRLDRRNARLSEDIFFSGDTVTGHVLLSVKYQLKAVGIILRCVGKKKLGNVTETITITERPIILVGKAKGRKHITIPARSQPYRYDFKVNLPSSLPPSVECPPCFVRYYFQAKVVRIQARNHLKTGHKEFLVYQNNANFSNQLSEPQEPTEHAATIDPLSITYEIPKMAYYVGDTPVVIGSIYNKGPSKAKVKVGIEVEQTTIIHGELNLGVKSFSKKYESKRGGGFGYWSQDFAIPPRCTEDFSAEFNLESMPPTSTCEQIDIRHRLILKILIQKKHSLVKPKPKTFPHDIIIGSSMNRPSPSQMKKSSSNVSIGRASIKRRRGTGTPLNDMFGQSHDSSRPTFSLDDSTGSAGAPSHSAGGFCRSVSQGAHMSHSVGTRRQVSQPTPAPRSVLSYGTPPPRYCDL